ncbi:DNA recombination protein RmuC [Tepidiphilus succinatimandens]|uniref:DNA recombination protein RmuC n=1 Tax=Tepidiphilus succinatimandens TaxID=224436 RepID=UPI00112F1D3D|nr:DNA recombination protein RmuC [Tepidiphilus succinatimandens]
MDFLLLIVLATAVGAALSFLGARLALSAQRASFERELAQRQEAELRLQSELRQRIEAIEGERRALHEEVAQLRGELAHRAGLEERLAEAKQRLAEVQDRWQQTLEENRSLAERQAALAQELEAERRAAAEKLRLLEDARQQLTEQFKNLANDILEEKSRRFTEQNQNELGALLEPLKLRLTEFQRKVEEAYVTEGKDRTALAEQVRQLMALNQTLSREARQLTEALKGSSKTQGTWGELVLERVLEASGLRRGEEYEVQVAHTDGEGRRLQPDVVIRLPEGRHLVIDAKVSLNAYEAYVAAENDGERQGALKRHLDSVRTHMKGLSQKRYEQLYGVSSLDFVLLFVPIEPAFMLAVTHDKELFMDAWQRNVLLVSPSTLLFVVRTVAHLWRQEQQNRNAQEIAKRGAELYDKLAGFVTDLQALGQRLEQARSEYDKAMAKLVAGRGNLLHRAESLKALGVKPGKNLPLGLLGEDPEADGPLAETAEEPRR